MNNYIFGPVQSRRFGLSLGIDLSPNKKQCNFDCLYCELSPAKTMDSYEDVANPEDIVLQLKEALEKHKNIDVITITANGEPTLYPHLKELIELINGFKENTQTLILSNGSTIANLEVQESLMLLDQVKLSLDCISEKCFKRLDRVDKSINLTALKESMKQFSKRYKGTLLIEVLFVENINDKDEEIELLNETLKQINPTRVDIGTIDRPPAFDVKALSYEKLLEIARKFDATLNIHIASRHKGEKIEDSYSSEEILQTLSKRPLTKGDIDTLFDADSKAILDDLVQKNDVYINADDNVHFYCLKS